MDRLFLDANVLFSAAYRPGAGLLRLWKLPNVILCSSRYALEEARANLSTESQRSRLRADRTAPVARAKIVPAGFRIPVANGVACDFSTHFHSHIKLLNAWQTPFNHSTSATLIRIHPARSNKYSVNVERY